MLATHLQATVLYNTHFLGTTADLPKTPRPQQQPCYCGGPVSGVGVPMEGHDPFNDCVLELLVRYWHNHHHSSPRGHYELNKEILQLPYKPLQL